MRFAATDLGLHLVRDRDLGKHKNIQDFQRQDDCKAKIEITIEGRSAYLCRCRVNVGLFGSEPTARLITSRIEAHLPHP